MRRREAPVALVYRSAVVGLFFAGMAAGTLFSSAFGAAFLLPLGLAFGFVALIALRVNVRSDPPPDVPTMIYERDRED